LEKVLNMQSVQRAIDSACEGLLLGFGRRGSSASYLLRPLNGA
jgi:hypothetical protein